LNKLKELDISNTDIDSGLEYLPESVEDFACSEDKRKNARCQTLYNLFANEQGEVETEHGKIKNETASKVLDIFQFETENRITEMRKQNQDYYQAQVVHNPPKTN